jgi:hypothetical protein
MYNICSWEVTECNNPMFAEFHNGVVAGFQDFFKAYQEKESKEKTKEVEDKKETNE